MWFKNPMRHSWSKTLARSDALQKGHLRYQHSVDTFGTSLHFITYKMSRHLSRRTGIGIRSVSTMVLECGVSAHTLPNI